MEKKNYSGLTLMSAGICNLNCSFCFLQNKNFQSVKDQHNTIVTAWKDGTYLSTVEQIFLQNNFNFKDIQSLSLWGGESLLNINEITPNIAKIYELFPNLDHWMISTNFMININSLIDFFKEINKYHKKNTYFHLQLSIDGPPGIFIENGHNGNWDVYRKNLLKLIDFFNTNRFNNFKVGIGVNSVLSKDVFLEHLNTKEKIFQYISYMEDFLLYQNQIINTGNLQINQKYNLPKMDTTAILNSEERNQLLYIYNLFESIKYEFNAKDKENFTNLNLYQGIHHDFINNKKIVSLNSECGGALKNNLTIMPDGTLVRCSSCYMANNEKHQQELIENNDEQNLIVNRHETAISINLLTSSLKERDEYDWNVLHGIKNTSSTYIKMMYSACKELLGSHQILDKYNDSQLLLKHLTAVSHLLACDKENTFHTNISYLPSLNLLRRYFNGLVDNAFEQKINKIKYK